MSLSGSDYMLEEVCYIQLSKTLLKHYLICERFCLSQADFHWQYFVCDSEDNSHDPKLITSVFCFVFHT